MIEVEFEVDVDDLARQLETLSTPALENLLSLLDGEIEHPFFDFLRCDFVPARDAGTPGKVIYRFELPGDGDFGFPAGGANCCNF